MALQKLTLVFLRGLIRESRHWRPFMEVFSKNYPDWELLSLDAPGTGKYHQEKSPSAIPDYINPLRNQIKDTLKNRKNPVVLVSISLGGMIGAEWLKQYPKDFDAFVIMNSSFSNLTSPFKRLTPSALKQIGRAIKTTETEAREREVLEMVSNSKETVEKILPLWTQIQQSAPVTGANFARQLFAASRYKLDQAAPSIPCLVMYSKKDRMVDSDASKKIVERWMCSWRCHPSAGHNLPDDAPDWTLSEMVNWLEVYFSIAPEDKTSSKTEQLANSDAAAKPGFKGTISETQTPTPSPSP